MTLRVHHYSHLPTKENTVQTKINNYIPARDAFEREGGEHFYTDRRTVRAAYCNANVSPDTVGKWIDRLPANETVKTEFQQRFQEWDNKMIKGILKKSEQPSLSDVEFLNQLQAYYDKHQAFLASDTFAKFMQAKNSLRTELLPEIREHGTDWVIKFHGIQDPELISRIRNEWSWK